MSAFSTIACCLCGTSIEPNEVAMCLVCLRGEVNITDGIGRHAEVIQCTKCDRWFSQKDTWVFHEMESTGLMSLCLKKVTGINKVRIIDAFWIWTEPHSKRLKIGIEIEKAVLDGKMNIRQKIEVEYVVKNKQCIECIREASEHSWGAQIQLRQRNTDLRSLISLESELTKAGMHNLMLGIDIVKYGMDIFFMNKNQAEKVIQFISNYLPTKVKSSKKMVSSNKQSNTQKYEYVYVVDVIPLVKFDLVYLTKDINKLIAQPEFMFVEKVSSSIHFLNPLNLKRIEMNSSKYFSLHVPIVSLMNSKQLVSFIVLDIELIENNDGDRYNNLIHNEEDENKKDHNGLLAEVTVAKESDLGENDITYTTTTHLGHILRVGDIVLGYDIIHSTISFDSTSIDESKINFPTDIILVKKGETSTNKSGKKSSKSTKSRRNKKESNNNDVFDYSETDLQTIEDNGDNFDEFGSVNEDNDDDQNDNDNNNNDDDGDDQNDNEDNNDEYLSKSLGNIIQSAQFEKSHIKRESNHDIEENLNNQSNENDSNLEEQTSNNQSNVVNDIIIKEETEEEKEQQSR